MVVHTSQEDFSGYSAFNIHNIVYKTVDSHNIDLDVFIPKNFTPPSDGAPIILRYHGGGLFTGSSLTPLFWCEHVLDLAIEQSAVIVSPNYSLLPEAAITDILADLEDSWRWLHSSLAPFLQSTNSNIIPNLDRVLVFGDSAGGWLALQLAFDHPMAIQALAVSYRQTPAAMLDIASSHFSTSSPKQIMSFPAPPRAALDEHLSSLALPTPTIPTTVSSDLTLARFPLMLITLQHGLFPLFIPASSPNLFPIERVARGDSLPKGGCLILHGKADSVVPVEGSRRFVEAVEKKKGEGKWEGGEVVLVEREGEHGFDTALGLDDGGEGEEGWLRRAWAPMVEAWLG